MDSVYLLEVVLEHLERPSLATTRIIQEHQIDTRDAKEIRHLLEYHYNITQTQYRDAEIFYPMLRMGLKEYFDKYLTEGYVRITEKMPEPHSILDFGAGEGHVAKWMRRRYKSALVYTLDKAPIEDPLHIKVDFEEKPDWWRDKWEESFDLIILSEVLHCKKPLTQMYVIDTCEHLLKKKGRLVIVEPVDYVMARRIAKLKKATGYAVLDEHHIRELMPSSFILHNIIRVQKHKFYQYEKI